MKRIHYIIIRTLILLQKKCNAKQFLILSSILVGISCGLAAIVLKLFAHAIHHFVQSYSSSYQEFFLFTLFPFLGLTATVLYLRHFIKKNEFLKSTADVVYSIAKKSSSLPKSQVYSHIISSAFTVGFGGSVGLESPLACSGAAIGATYGRTYRMSYKDKTLLLGCGAAAAIASAFNSPIAGVLFTIEVLLTDFSVSAFVPLIIAAAAGGLVSQIILGEGVLLYFDTAQPFDYANTPFYILLGIVAGFLSLYYMHTFSYIESRMQSIRKTHTKVLIGSGILAILLILFPPLFGEGYEGIKSLAALDINALLANSILYPLITTKWAGLIFLVVMMLVKVVATAVTIGSGGNGGSFAPSLCIGGYLGYAFSDFINSMGWGNLPQNNFTLVAMAGILSGIFHAPLTAIFLIAEVTGGYNLMIPLMIVAAISTVIVKYFEPLSLENKKLATRMNLHTGSRDMYLLSKLNLNKLIETNFHAVKPDDTLRVLVHAISQSKRNFFPVVDDNKQLVGIVLLDRVKDIIFDQKRYDTVKIKELISMSYDFITPDESLDSVLKKFEETDQWNLPVIENGKYRGFLSKSRVLSEYRDELRRSS